MARTKCTHCGVRFKVPNEALDRMAKCPKCGERFRVEPLAETTAAPPPDTTLRRRRPLTLILSVIAAVVVVAAAIAIVSGFGFFGDDAPSSGFDLDADREQRQARLETDLKFREAGQAQGERFRMSIEEKAKAKYQASLLGSWERLRSAPEQSSLKYPTIIEFRQDNVLMTDMNGDGNMVEGTYSVDHLSMLEFRIGNRLYRGHSIRQTTLRLGQVTYGRTKTDGTLVDPTLKEPEVDLSLASKAPEVPKGWAKPLTESQEKILGTWKPDRRDGLPLRFLEEARVILDPDATSAVTGFYTFEDGRLRIQVREKPILSMIDGYVVDDDLLVLFRRGQVTYYVRATQSPEEAAAQQERLSNRPVAEKPIAAADNYGLGLSIIPPRELEVQGLTVDAPLVFMSAQRLKYFNLLFLVEPGTSIGYLDPMSRRTRSLILASLRRVTWDQRVRPASLHPDGEINRIYVRPGERQIYCELVAYRPTYGSSFITRLVTVTGLSVRDTEIDPHVAAILASESLDRFHPHVQIAIWLAARQNVTFENVNDSYPDHPFSEADWNRAVALEERTRS